MSGDDLAERRFAGAVAADDTDLLVFCDRHAQVIEDDLSAVGFIDISEL